ncbi:MAG TPA: pyridoxal 5'-phosphate synthase glutaminase subunit PdxT [Thermotogota bacterium]|nr:pyridoxal 5'-phosphate synthase glutaminase subunit PdxT [Thermotogota bacterium]HPJ89134.1 pyridoxal 5'-phosphate synthase glutaminase subunit PdxT [Thermotogota bacterium]
MKSTFIPEKPVGILAMQGAIEEHEAVMHDLGVRTIRVKRPEQLEMISGLLMPGGESTAMIKLLRFMHMTEPMQYWIKERKMPVLATCAGMILLSSGVDNYPQQPTLRILDATVMRNAFGRQIDSFEEPFSIKGFDEDFNAVFIRAPIITKMSAEMEILAWHKDQIVMVRQDNILACSFHPELTGDFRIHKLFLKRVEEWENSQNSKVPSCSDSKLTPSL